MNRYEWNRSLDWGTCTLKRGQWRIQLYWPYLRVRHVAKQRNHRELLVSADTVIRIATEDRYFGIGIQLLGFGIACDRYEPLPVE